MRVRTHDFVPKDLRMLLVSAVSQQLPLEKIGGLGEYSEYCKEELLSWFVDMYGSHQNCEHRVDKGMHSITQSPLCC